VLPALSNGTGLAPYQPANRLTSLFDQFFNDGGFTPAWTPVPLSLWQDEDHVYVEADLPGLTEQDVELTVHDGELTLRGERKCERQDCLYEGRRFGRFEQRITLPADVDPDAVEARLANGVLRVTFPKSPASKPRKIAVKAD
jgi:HSP20 family protein